MDAALDMLVFGAHPDDAEIGMGGTIYKHTLKGFKVGICDLTYAELSSNGTVEMRRQEAAEAANILGLSMRSNLGFPDRGLGKTREQIDRITAEIRKYRPKIVFAPYWQDRHPDHIACSILIKEAVFNAKLRRYMPELPAWTVEQTYFYYINDLFAPNVIVDVTGQYDIKQKALAAYRSQFQGEGEDVVATPLNSGYVQQVEARDKVLGHKRSVQYAEGFASELPLMIDTF